MGLPWGWRSHTSCGKDQARVSSCRSSFDSFITSGSSMNRSVTALLAVATCPASEVRAGSGVSSVYDYSRSTADNYEQKGARLRREFFSTRAGLDYTYHTRFSLERQALQDDIIRSMLSYEDMQRGTPNRRSELDRVARGAANKLRSSQQPWAVFTAGCMGAGKTCARPVDAS